MIDLHMHTVNSDGKRTVEQALEKAEELGLDAISITDHESCQAYNDLKNENIRKKFSGKIIPGVEIKCVYKGRVIDVLGYDIDIEKMNLWLKRTYKGKTHDKLEEKYLKKHYQTFSKMGVKLPKYEDIKWDRYHDWANLVIYGVIKSNPENENVVPKDMWETYENFRFNYCYNANSEFYIDKSQDYVSIEDGIKAIHECDGKAFIAHVYIYTWAENKEEFINDLITKYEFDGIECYYSKFTEEQIKYIEKICKENNLLLSGGSDSHGKPELEIGTGRGNLKVPNHIIDWAEKVI